MSAVSPFRTFKAKPRANGRQASAAIRRRLQQRARAIHSRQQFETIVGTATHPERVRALLEPLLRTGLPCCLMAAKGEHTEGCPQVQMDKDAVVMAEAVEGQFPPPASINRPYDDGKVS